MEKEFFLPKINKDQLNVTLEAVHPYSLMELLVEPLHEELYRRQSFDFMDDLTEGQQLILSFDYVLMQVKGGGFLQLLHNGYAGLLLDLPEQFQAINCIEMAALIDKVLQFYVPNRAEIEKQMSVEEFAKLYDKFPEISVLDEQFIAIYLDVLKKINVYIKGHIQEFTMLTD